MLRLQQKNREEINRLFDQLFLNNPILLLDNVKIYLPLFYTDHIQKTIYQTKNFYEFETLEFLRLHYRNFSHIVDVGSNIGNHMLFYCSKMKVENVFCFEPNTISREVLQKNVALNNLEKVVAVYPFALGKEPGVGAQSNFTQQNTGMNRVARINGSEEAIQSPVEIRSLDSFALNRVDFLKIDVEGFELEVLQGAEETVRRCRPVILVEVFESNREEVDTLLRSYGYHKFFAFKEFDLLYTPD